MTNPFFWPGTKIVKSLNNDFNWQRGDSWLYKEMKAHLSKSNSGRLGAMAARGKLTDPKEKPFQQIMAVFSRAKR